MKLVLPYNIKEQLRLYVHSLDNEISGFGKIEFSEEEDTCTVTELKIFKQEVSGGSSDLDGQSIAQFITERVKAGESLGGWNLWWHSHNSMGVFWSGIDTGTMDVNPLDAPYMVSLVTNNKGEYRARIDLYEPTHMFVDELTVVEEYPQDNSLQAQIEKEVKELVEQTKPIVISKHTNSRTVGQIMKEERELKWTSADGTKYGDEDDLGLTQQYADEEPILTAEELTIAAIELAEKHNLKELEDLYDVANFDQFMSYDQFAIIEQALEFKEFENKKRTEKPKKKHKKSKKSKK